MRGSDTHASGASWQCFSLTQTAAVRAVATRRVRRGPPPASAGLGLLAPRGTSWRFTALDVEFADLRAAGKAAGGSLNDAFVSALLGAFRRYHEQLSAPLPAQATMPISVPVSIRRDTDGGGGNRLAPARLAGPVGIIDRAENMTRSLRPYKQPIISAPYW